MSRLDVAASGPRTSRRVGQAEMLPRPNAIFAAASHARSARPARTVQLLAQTLGLELRDHHGSDNVDALVQEIRACAGVVMVCWRHESMAANARARIPRRHHGGSRMGRSAIRRCVGTGAGRRQMEFATTPTVASARRLAGSDSISGEHEGNRPRRPVPVPCTPTCLIQHAERDAGAVRAAEFRRALPCALEHPQGTRAQFHPCQTSHPS
jgi:hypothetical protein